MILIDIDTLGPKSLIITKTLIAELMGKYSNLILMQDGTIIEAFRRVGEIAIVCVLSYLVKIMKSHLFKTK